MREALGRYLGVATGRVLPTNGGAEAIFWAARLAAGRGGGKALIPVPTFSEYAAAARAAGLEPVGRICRRPETGFELDESVFDDLDGVAVVFLCNPNNPTGEALSREAVVRVLSRVREAGAALVVDEAFADFVPEVSVADLEDDGLFVARSFTKFFAIPGLRLGALVCADLEAARALQPSWSVNAVAAAGEVGFAEWSIGEVRRLRSELAVDLGSVPGIEVYPGTANFLLLRAPRGTVTRLARDGVLVRGCEPFVGLNEEFLRVAVRGAEENRRLVDALRSVV